RLHQWTSWFGFRSPVAGHRERRVRRLALDRDCVARPDVVDRRRLEIEHRRQRGADHDRRYFRSGDLSVSRIRAWRRLDSPGRRQGLENGAAGRLFGGLPGAPGPGSAGEQNGASGRQIIDAETNTTVTLRRPLAPASGRLKRTFGLSHISMSIATSRLGDEWVSAPDEI